MSDISVKGKGGGKNKAYFFLLITALMVAFFVKMYDFDIFYHLAIGREIFRLGTLPDTEFYLYTMQNTPTMFHEWGFALLFYMAQHFGGYLGSSLLNAAMATTTIMLFFMAALVAKDGSGGKKRAGIVSLVFLFALIMIIGQRMIYRPEMILYLMMAAMVFVLEKYAVSQNKKLLLWLPLFSFILAQAHPSGFLLFGVFGFYALQFLIEAKKSKRLGVIIRFGIVGISMVVAHLINPYHYHQLIAPFLFAGEEGLTSTNAEYLRIWQSDMLNMYLALAALGIYALLKLEKPRLVDVLCYLAFGIFAALYHRNLALFGLILIVPLMRLSFQMQVSLKPKEKIIFGFGALVLYAICLFTPIKNGQWGYGVWEQRFPTRLTDIIRENPNEQQSEGNLFNDYGLGGFAAWEIYPTRQIFIDGRHYQPSQMLYDYSDIAFGEEGWQEVLESYDIDTMLLSIKNAVTGETMPVVSNMAELDGWNYIGAESGAILFVRDDVLDLYEDIDPSPQTVAEAISE